ncbi:glycosyl transferase [Candidatus Methylacidiphilum fumarolicum]|uniref:Glycosyltransferase n=2 Tax=Candidatus Methylacidiphilum fumarolicum TaxID=591154 RepID=I0JX96_METFB|nr:cellulose synthase family protein [Candidatus Methylacidiphilum fumarolicum]MBW6414311.1 glycosyltransferase family 2 protein [Candidatus Methylacidiphilum fumarolicum]TFE67763.1 glycosyl transferase [Candidatus Methylacidiphilum fumarolicum]TFE71942.1 glycosyl transferase [Candidatus Methylacidiphilum fumarolicum]TFE72134.1 glycosyl transferase [Candidatus Methylacidiphilum fumarolicum]TFE76611.1 glycosyl transferase [Candidatus Methylacidiphilum fumarolicum]
MISFGFLMLALILLIHGIYRISLVFRLFLGSNGEKKKQENILFTDSCPEVTIQLPIYNEKSVVERLLYAVCAIDYPKEKMEIQIIDDSTDETTAIVSGLIADFKKRGFDIQHLQRGTRAGYKAGGLQYGLEKAKGEFIAIFDADFIPPPSFLKNTLPYFSSPKIGMVQARWGYLNRNSNLLTRCQALFLDGHFLLEQPVRYKQNLFFNFNGTAGVWRKQCIIDAGGWEGDTLTEDLDLSYRAQFKGWKFVYTQKMVVPSELPSPIVAFRTQQHRWAKGAIQTAKKHLLSLLRGSFPTTSKIEGLFHLLAHSIHPIVALLVILNAVTFFSAPQEKSSVQVFAGILFSVISLFYISYLSVILILSKKFELSTLFILPFSMAMALGMTFANTKSVIDGLFGKNNIFVRTPKNGSFNPQKPIYKVEHSLTLPLLETLAATVFSIALYQAFQKHLWVSVPTLFLHTMGFGYVGIATLYSIIKMKKIPSNH